MRYYIVTGEPSGDIHAANLVRELKNVDTDIIVRAWGGERLIAEGVSLAKNIKDTAFMGLWNVIKNLRSIRSNLNFCQQDILDFKPDALILVDYPGFNLKIAEFAKQQGIKVFYYIPPKTWAWNKSRLLKIKKFVDHLLVIFPFEVDFYKRNGVEVIYVGNPLLDEINHKDHVLSFKSSKPIIALLPGSRKQEIEAILPKMLTVVEDYPDYQFVIAATNTFSHEYYKSFIKEEVGVVFDQTYGLLAHAQLALVASGTATLEAALFKVPQVVCYKTNWVTYIVARFLIKIEHLSLVNILLEKTAVRELIQSELNKKNLKKELDVLINERDRVLSDYTKLSEVLSKEDASKNAANFIIDAI